MTELRLVIIKKARYNELIKKKISSGQGDRNPWKSKFPTGGIVRDPRNAADLVTDTSEFQNRQ